MTNQLTGLRSTVLVVEDDPAVRLSIRLALAKEGFTVVEAASGGEALDLLRQQTFSLVLLDLMLPEIGGLDVFRALRQRDPEQPVIMVTAKDEEVDRIVGLELGADDYVTKPFSPRELIARIRAVLRRAQPVRVGVAVAVGGSGLEEETLHTGDLTVAVERHEVFVGARRVALTRTEFDLLAALMRNPGRVLTRDQLVSSVWGYESEGSTRLLDSHIGHLRHKIEADPAHPRYILTVRDVGYKFAAEEAPGTSRQSPDRL